MAVDIPNFSRSKPIVFISSSIINLDDNSSSLDYFVQILSLISQKINDIINTDLIVKIPKSNKPGEQKEFIDEVYKNKENYSAIIISPINEEEILHALEKYVKSLDDYKSLPVFTIDKFLSNPVNNIDIPFVTSDWEHGGECAAKCAVDHIKSPLEGKEIFEILILKGLEGSEARIRGFQKYIENSEECNRIKHLILKDKDNLNFTREGTYTFLKKYIEKNAFTFDIIFACNDEMALGAYDFVLERTEEKYKKIKIIGFDGTKEFIISMNHTENKNLLATINVQIETQIDKLIILMIKVVGNIKNFTNSDLNNKIKVECKAESVEKKKNDR